MDRDTINLVFNGKSVKLFKDKVEAYYVEERIVGDSPKEYQVIVYTSSTRVYTSGWLSKKKSDAILKSLIS